MADRTFYARSGKDRTRKPENKIEKPGIKLQELIAKVSAQPLQTKPEVNIRHDKRK